MSDTTWVFGYGSLIWKQDFPFEEARPAYVLDWERRLWQGSTDHRGAPECPGRVATLIRSVGAVCWGLAFRLRCSESDAVLQHLDHRERGGYSRLVADLFLRDEGSVSGLVYLADESNPEFLGPAPPVAIAAQVQRARGLSGPNTEYVHRLAYSLRELGTDDPHVFEVAALLEQPEQD